MGPPSTQFPIQWVSVALSPGVKPPGPEVEHLHVVPNSGAVFALFQTSSWHGA
jgi:hypothetical protein